MEALYLNNFQPEPRQSFPCPTSILPHCGYNDFAKVTCGFNDVLLNLKLQLWVEIEPTTLNNPCSWFGCSNLCDIYVCHFFIFLTCLVTIVSWNVAFCHGFFIYESIKICNEIGIIYILFIILTSRKSVTGIFFVNRNINSLLPKIYEMRYFTNLNNRNETLTVIIVIKRHQQRTNTQWWYGLLC